MPETATLEKDKADDKPADMKDFQPLDNTLLDSLGLSDDQIAENEAKKEQEKQQEEAKDQEVVETPSEDIKSDDDDFTVPEKDNLGLDDPLEVKIDKDKEPEKEPKDTEDQDVIDKKDRNSSFRLQVAEATKRAKSATEQAERLNSENEELKAQRTVLEKSLEEARTKLSFKDPSQHPEVQALVKPWDDELNAKSQEIAINGGDGVKLKIHAEKWVRQLRDLGDPSSEGFDQRRDEFVAEISDAYPDDHKEIITMLSKGSSTLSEAESLMEKIRVNGSEYEATEALKAFDRLRKGYSDIEKSFFNPSDDLRESDPFHSRVILADIIAGDEAAKERSERVKKFVRQAVLPLPPVGNEELRGMDDESATNYLHERMVQKQGVENKLKDMMPEAIMSMMVLPSIWKLAMDASSENEEIRKANPKLTGDLEEDEESSKEKEETPEDIKDFEPGASKLKF